MHENECAIFQTKAHHIPSSHHLLLHPKQTIVFDFMPQMSNKKRKVFVLQDTATDKMDPIQEPIQELFIFSPFGLCCRLCKSNVIIQLNKRCISRHLKKHNLDSRVAFVRSLHLTFKAKLDFVKASGSIELYRSDKNTYIGYSCSCGKVFQLRKDNALRHCRKMNCDPSKVQTVEFIKLHTGQYVSRAQITSFFNDIPRITHQFDYCQTRATLVPFLPQWEKYDHTYTHMYTPLIIGCGGGDQFVLKIKQGFVSIHSPPSQCVESVLIKIHKQAEIWLLNFAQKNILMVPGNLRAGLQTLKGCEVDEVSQHQTYTMQHDPRRLLPELKKTLIIFLQTRTFCIKCLWYKWQLCSCIFLEGFFAWSPNIGCLASFCGGILSHVFIPCICSEFKNIFDIMWYGVILILQDCISSESSGLFCHLFFFGSVTH